MDLSVRTAWSLGPLLCLTAKQLTLFQAKVDLWTSFFAHLYSDEKPQFVILNRHNSLFATNSTAQSHQNLTHTPTQQVRQSTVSTSPSVSPSASGSRLLFMQLYNHVGRLIDPTALRRRGQAWMVKFVGESGHDAGGMYNESLMHVCAELQATASRMHTSTTSIQQQPLGLLVPCANRVHPITLTSPIRRTLRTLIRSKPDLR